jgi:hypothetical protein
MSTQANVWRGRLNRKTVKFTADSKTSLQREIALQRRMRFASYAPGALDDSSRFRPTVHFFPCREQPLDHAAGGAIAALRRSPKT